MAKQNLTEQAKQIIAQAEEAGVQSNFFFLTTFKRYQRQLKILDELEKSIDEHGMQITKEYVKGRENLCSNPAIADYNRTVDSSNKTVSCLMRILREYGADKSKKDDRDPLLDIINGGGLDE